MSPADLLGNALWTCAASAAGSDEVPPGAVWRPASVPGTAAQACVAARITGALERDYDGEDWWWRSQFTVPQSGCYDLRFGGLATLADVWVDGEHLLHSTNMFIAHTITLPLTEGVHRLLIRCASLMPTLRQRRPRPRWKSPDLVHQNLRWIRTSLIGRQVGGVQLPAPVGPWRAITLVRHPELAVRRTALQARYDDGAGWLSVEASVHGLVQRDVVTLLVNGRRHPMRVTRSPSEVIVAADIRLPEVDPWWPHTHGAQPLYDVEIEVEHERHSVGRVGFRRLEVDRSDGAFTLSCNGLPLFARGACWSPTDPITLQDDDLRSWLTLLRDGGHNLVRVTGTGTYVSDEFLDLCDELGLLVWQDCMLAFFDAPDDPGFSGDLSGELRQLFESYQGRPCLAVVCGSSDAEEQAAYLGLPRDRWVAPVARTVIPELLDELLPGTVYVRSSPGESPLPSMVKSGPSHYYGVGAYFQPTSDARRAGVRFASECLCMATPAEPLDTVLGDVATRRLGHHPAWKALIHRDAQSSWDLEDVREWYTKHLFGLDPIEVRRVGGERAARIARATVATVFEEVLSEWRRPGSTCRGAVVFEAHDTGFGGGIGLIDGLRRPKAPWFVMRRLMQPVVVTITNEGVNGLGVHVANDGPHPWSGQLRIELVIDGERIGESLTQPIEVPVPGLEVDLMVLLGEFRDISWIHRFGPPAYDVVAASLLSGDTQISQAVFVAGDRLRPTEPDIGLRAETTPGAAGRWQLEVSTRRFAQWVQIDLDDGWRPADNWFHLLPGTARTVPIIPLGGDPDRRPRGQVQAMNCPHPQPVSVTS